MKFDWEGVKFSAYLLSADRWIVSANGVTIGIDTEDNPEQYAIRWLAWQRDIPKTDNQSRHTVSM